MMKPLSREEILEQAGLDVLGLLTEEERSVFETVIENADASLRDEVRRIQDGILVFRDTLPDVQPSPGLRRRVLAAVGRMIEQDLHDSVQEAGSRRLYIGERRDWLEPLISGRVSPFWRLGALIAATIMIALGWWAFELNNASRILTRHLAQQETRKLIKELEQHLGELPQDFLFDSTTESIFFESVDDELAGLVRVMYRSNVNEGFILSNYLPARTTSYRLCIRQTGDGPVDDPADLETVAEFKSDGGPLAVHFNLGDLNTNGASWYVLAVEGDGATTGAHGVTVPTAESYRIIMKSVA